MIRHLRQWTALLRAELRSALPVACAAAAILMAALALVAAMYGEPAVRYAVGAKVLLGTALATLPVVALVFDGGTRLDTVTRATPTRRWISLVSKVASVALIFATIAALAWVCDRTACAVANRIVPVSPIAQLGESIKSDPVFWGWIVMTYAIVAIVSSQTRSALSATMFGLVYALAICMTASMMRTPSESLLLRTALVHMLWTMNEGATPVGGACAVLALGVAFQRRGAFGRALAGRAVILIAALSVLLVAPILARSASHAFVSPVEFESAGSRVDDLRVSPDGETLALLIHDAERQATTLWFVDTASGKRTRVDSEPLERWSEDGLPHTFFNIDGWSSDSGELTVTGFATYAGYMRQATFTRHGVFVEDRDTADWGTLRRRNGGVDVQLRWSEGEGGKTLVAQLDGHNPVRIECETPLGMHQHGSTFVDVLTADGALQRWFLATGKMEGFAYRRRWEESLISVSPDGEYVLERRDHEFPVLTSLEDGRTRALTGRSTEWTKRSAPLLEYSQRHASRWVLHSIDGVVELEFASGASKLIDVDGEHWLTVRGNRSIDLYDAAGGHVRSIRRGRIPNQGVRQ